MRKNKKQKGFTLVEVIVVAVIVAVLAAVAIPLYNGYVKDSRMNVCQNTAASIASMYVAANSQDIAPTQTANNVTVLGKSGDNSTIDLPTDYWISSVASNLVIVNGPGGSYGTCVY